MLHERVQKLKKAAPFSKLKITYITKLKSLPIYNLFFIIGVNGYDNYPLEV